MCTNNTTTLQALRVQQDMSARAAFAKSNKLPEQLAELQKKVNELQCEKVRLSLLLKDSQVATASQGTRKTKKSRTNGVLFLFY